MLDDNMNEISSFRIYVRPQYNDEIAPYCRELTGITMNRLFCADHFPEAFHKFSEWCRSEGEDFQIFAWSGSDLLQLREQMNLYGIVMTDEVRYMTENWKDFQEEYRQIAGEEDFPSLDRALNMAGCPFTGTRHEALWDARNTADLFVLTRDLEDFQKRRKNPRSDGAEAAVLQSGKFLHGGKTEGIPGILLLTKIFALAEGGDISAELIKKSPGNGAFYFERSIPGRFFLSDPAE